MRTVLVLTLLLSTLALPTAPRPKETGPPAPPVQREQQINQIIDSLTPEERVGQLMLVTFDGYLGPASPVIELITDYNIGGVLLLAEHDNIIGPINTPRLVQSLANDLQNAAYDATLSAVDPATPSDPDKTPRPFVPLFVGTIHSGNGQPGTQIANGTTPLPSQMAIGATWEPEYARQVGQIAGAELEAMGINLLLGPALDVPPQPQAQSTLDLSVDTFGGEPYWVGRMGQAYVTGVHEGSQGRIAVIARHFPGLGLADTQPDEEIPVVPRTLDELNQFDLIPYRAVTGDATDPLAQVEGMQCANIRYQGANTGSVTRPVCVDEGAAGQLLALDAFRDWRSDGLMVSSALGTTAIRRYYSVTPFPHRQVAREAFLAGNDLLLLDDFGPAPSEDQRPNVIDVIEFFAEGYEDDPVFRARVDESLRRILAHKLALYDDDLSLDNVTRAVNSISAVGGASVPLYTIAQRSLTLLAPRRENLPPPPARDENIMVFTDVRLIQQCSYCAQYALVEFNALEFAIERLYGPFAGAQVRPERVTSFSFRQLEYYLVGDIVGASESQFKTIQRIGEALRDVDWIVFLLFDNSPEVEAADALRDFLATQSMLLDRAHVVVFALGAPTYLSATEISKLTAYFSLYSHTPPFIDAAARALFQEITPSGTLPISVPALGYDVLERTSPAPDQTIRLEIEAPGNNSTPTALNPADIIPARTGDRLVVRTAPIRDRNGHIVPDNTTVEFTMTFVTDNIQTRRSSVTRDGMAQVSFVPTRPGRIQITASSGAATRSTMLQVMVAEGNAMPGQTGEPASDPTQTSPGEDTPAATRTPPGSPQAVVQAPQEGPPTGPTGEPAGAGPVTEAGAEGPLATGQPAPAITDTRRLDMVDLVVSLLGLLVVSTLGYSTGVSATLSTDGGVRLLLGSAVAGLTGYIYYGLGGPGVDEIAAHLDELAALVTTLGAGLVGLLYTWLTVRHFPGQR